MACEITFWFVDLERKPLEDIDDIDKTTEVQRNRGIVREKHSGKFGAVVNK